MIRQHCVCGNRSNHGPHFTVENSRLYTLPDVLPPLYVAAGGPRGAEQAGRLGDGLIGTDPDPALLAAFDAAGGAGKPRYAELTVCYAKDEPTARHAADLGIIPVVVQDACGGGHDHAAERSLESLVFAGDAIVADSKSVCEFWQRAK